MSDEQNREEPYRSEVDSAFAAAWNEVYSPEEPEETETGEEQVPAAGEGTETPAPADEGAGAEGGSTGAQDAGAAQQPAEPAASSGEPSDQPAAPATDQPGGTHEPAVAGIDHSTVREQFGTAYNAIQERLDKSFEAQAMEELRSKIDEKYFSHLSQHPMALVGLKVPSIRPGEEDMLLRDTQDARDWQEATKQLMEAEIESIKGQKQDEARSIMSVIQDSVQRFQNNPDLVPGTKQYNPELAKKFTDIAKSYEVRVNGKLYGYQVNVQPLIDELRKQTQAVKPAAPQQTQRQQQAAQQARNEQGQFDAPQAGISSKSNMSGSGPEDDYSAFWKGVQMPGVSI